MKLKAIWIVIGELQDYLDKYEEKIKFIYMVTSGFAGHVPGSVMLVIDEA
jgi:hypothetical protein